ncbi:hypothetical protein CANARDRAFT_23337 [[Candida] arabinofermentans NRRL YB-2248]|uniref:Uncharacterized protein n=1 Tax=[Candida] arabinofermentans NRRL YB-2248 TaxID=983967 RepID=A0A1E4T0I1_9ASCO|nr:hypothetical protein CANARDRAFT_23337 [[Candida] arabinofermentans NRRL YB-2248]
MTSSQILNEAWSYISTSSVISITDVPNLIERIEAILHKDILSNEYKEFLIDFMLQYPELKLTKYQFRELFSRLFMLDFDTVLKEAKYDKLNLAKDTTETIQSELTSILKTNSKLSISELREKLMNQKSMLQRQLLKRQSLQNENLIQKKLIKIYSELQKLAVNKSSNYKNC